MRRRLLLATPLLIVALATPSAYHHARAAAVLMQVEKPGPNRPLVQLLHDVVTVDAPVGTNPAILYMPVGVADPPGLVLIHGVHHLGLQEPRLVNFARALAGSGIAVLTPFVASAADYRIEPEAIPTIGDAALALRRRLGRERVAVMGLSFCGGLALLAAADPRYAEAVSVAVSVGGHADMSRVGRFFATNQVEYPDGHRQPLPAHEYGQLVLVYDYAQEFFPPEEVALARDALRFWLYEQPRRAHDVLHQLSPASRERLEALFSGDRKLVAQKLTERLPAYRAPMDAVSPAGRLGSIQARVFLLHGTGDEVIPAAETLWLVREVPRDRLSEMLISPVVTHVELGGTPTKLDKLRLLHFMSEMLEAINE